MNTRRNFLRTASGILIAAPAIVRASSLMPVRSIKDPVEQFIVDAMASFEPWNEPRLDYVAHHPYIYHRGSVDDLVSQLVNSEFGLEIPIERN